MKLARVILTLVLVAGSPCLPALAAVAATDVKVELLGDPGPGGKLPKMAVVVQPDRIKAGEVRFLVVNGSKDLTHEMLLVQVKQSHRISYDPRSQKVIEDRLQKLADTDDIPPGGSKTVKATLGPGTYLVFCNEPGHYAHAMRATLVVTR